MSDQFNAPLPASEPPAQKRSPWITVLIIVVVLIILCCLCLLVVFVLLPAIFGPSIGNVFSNIMESITTPTP